MAKKVKKKYRHKGIRPKHMYASIISDKPWMGIKIPSKKYPQKVYPLGRPGKIAGISDKENERIQQNYDSLKEQILKEERARNYTHVYPIDTRTCVECGTAWPIVMIICEKCGTELQQPAWKLYNEKDKISTRIYEQGRIQEIIERAKGKGVISNAWGRKRVSREVRN